MNQRLFLNSIAVVGLSAVVAATGTAATIPFFFSTRDPDERLAHSRTLPRGAGLATKESGVI